MVCALVWHYAVRPRQGHAGSVTGHGVLGMAYLCVGVGGAPVEMSRCSVSLVGHGLSLLYLVRWLCLFAGFV